jgi:hypothetical protein
MEPGAALVPVAVLVELPAASERVAGLVERLAAWEPPDASEEQPAVLADPVSPDSQREPAVPAAAAERRWLAQDFPEAR